MGNDVKKRPKTAKVNSHHYSARKTWVFRVLALVLVPILLFSMVEAGLRLAGLGYPTKAIMEREIDGKTMCLPNTRFTWRFFPKQIAREFDGSFVFEKEKPDRTFRVFTVGGSAAMGPPEPMHNFGRYLEVMLSEMYPDIRFEVNNAAITAINSHVVRDIVRDCAQYDPDLFIVYLGNNEVVGPFGPGTVFTRTPPALPLIRANLALKSTRTGQLLDGLVRGRAADGATPRAWEGMSMFLDKQVRFDSGALDTVYRNFEENLQAVCKTARGSGAAVLFSNVGVNLKDCPPFASLHKEGLSKAELQAWEQDYQQGCADEAAGRYADAFESYQAAAGIDETYAELQYRLGRCCWNTGDFESARDHYEKAREYDTLRFRADARINESIRKVADGREGEGIYFVDSAEAFEEASPHRIFGDEMFYEHVHMNFKGNYTLARALIPAVQQVLSAQGHQSSMEIPSAEQVAAHVAYTPFEEADYLGRMAQDMMSKPPFTNQLNHDEWMNRTMSAVDRLRQSCDMNECQRRYDAAIHAHPEDWRLLVAQYHLRSIAGVKSDLKSEEAQLRNVLRLCPYRPAYFGLGRNLYDQGRMEESKVLLNQVLELRPNSSNAHYLLGEVARAQHAYVEAEKQYRRAIAIEPAASIMPYGLLVKTYAETGEPEKAIRVLNEALDIFSDAENAGWVHFQLGYLLFKAGESEQALEHMNDALRIRPDYAEQDDFQKKYSLMRYGSRP